MTRVSALLALLVALPSSTTSQDEASGTLLVANRIGGSISLFDLATRVEMARVPIGPVIPHEVAVSPDGRLALTGENGPNDNPGRHIVVIDVAEARLIGRIDLGPKSRPHSVVFLPDGRHAVATLEQSDQIAVVDTLERRVLRTYPTGGREGHMVRLSPDGKRAFVTSRGGEGTLSVITLGSEAPPLVIPTGEGAEGLAVTPDGREVWVVNRIARSISIVDTGSLKVIETIDVPPDARRAEVSASGRVLVPHGGSDTAPGQYLSVYDAKSRNLVNRLVMHEGRKGPGGFGVHVVGERAFVSDRADGALFIVDLDDLKSRHVLASGHGDPDGLAVSPVRLAVFQRAGHNGRSQVH
jgi:YVTN family beta-propeller protein